MCVHLCPAKGHASDLCGDLADISSPHGDALWHLRGLVPVKVKVIFHGAPMNNRKLFCFDTEKTMFVFQFSK